MAEHVVPDQSPGLRVQRRLPGPPAHAFAAWTEPSRVSVYLVASGADETELTLVHDRLPAGQVESHQGGWGQILDHLATLLAAGQTAWT